MSITDYGAFVELEAGIEGLIHVSEMSWTKKIKHPSKLLEVGQEVECQVLEVDAQAKRISLGLKQLEPDPWTIFTDRYHPGDKVSGKVRSITDYGVFVGIEEGVDGMAHKTDLSWTVKVNNPADLYAKGNDVTAIILSINHDEKKVSLGVKQVPKPRDNGAEGIGDAANADFRSPGLLKFRPHHHRAGHRYCHHGYAAVSLPCVRGFQAEGLCRPQEFENARHRVVVAAQHVRR
jgi:ribosomal protein S1